MVSKELLKEIIISNEEFISRQVKKITKREGISFPETLNKVVILFGVRRSGKTYILFDLFKKYKDQALYIDFEDEIKPISYLIYLRSIKTKHYI